MDSEIHHFKLDEGEVKSPLKPGDDRKEQTHEKSAQIRQSNDKDTLKEQSKQKDKRNEDANAKQRSTSTSSKPADFNILKNKQYPLPDRAELSWQGRESPETAASSSLSHIETVDSWIERDSRLIPLSAAIPFNAEPDASLLFGEKQNGITPASVHYVRNHGPVPRVDSSTFKLEIQLEAKPSSEESNKQPEPKDRSNDATGKKKKRIEKSHAWSFQELKSAFKPKSVLATLCCDGLRRKELNLLEHSKGFDTASGSVGTSVWTGVSLRQLVWKSLNGGNDNSEDMEEFFSQLPPFINVDGMDEPTHGHYGTTIPTAYGLNATSEVMVAYQQNGADLLPDHGAPLRLVVPGYVGGRWIKWVNKISFSHELSDSRYHHEDNRLYPSSVTLNALNSGQYFGKQHPEYTIYELNTNSVITKPSHEEEIQVSFNELETQSKDAGANEIEFAGYAYSGGGRRIHFVELSYNGGKSWKEAKVRHLDTKPENEHNDDKSSKKEGDKEDDKEKDASEEADWPQYSATDNWARRRKVWSWALWSLKVPVLDLIKCEEVMVRAVDEGSNGQRQELTWNATGMMNNAYYTLKLSQRKVEKLNLANPSQRPPSQLYFAFSHPVQAGLASGGWQAVKRRQSHAPTQQLHDMSRAGPLVGLAAHKAHKLLSASEIQEHRSPDDLWIVMDQQVFDVSAYAKYHPGGVHALLAASKIPPAELSQWFRSIHGRDAEEIKTWYAIGVVAADETIEAFHALAKERADKKQTQFISLHRDDDDDSSGSGLKLNYPTSKDSHKVPHRRPNWHESPVQRGDSKRLPQIASMPSESSQFLLHSSRWCPIVLAHSKQLTHDSYVFTFEAAEDVRDKYSYLGLITGQHLLIGAEINKEWVVRPYTPIWPCAYEEERMSDGFSMPGERDTSSQKRQLEQGKTDSNASSSAKSRSPDLHPASSGDATAENIQSAPPDDAQVRFQLLVKIYRQHHLMPGGVMSQFLERVALDKAEEKARRSLKVKGPTGCILYEGEGCFNIHTIGVQAKQINLIGAGTGITPLYQLVRAILLLGGETERQANVQIRLVFSNKSMQDILLLRELHELQKRCPDRFKVCFCVTTPFREEGEGKKKDSQDNKKEGAESGKDKDKDQQQNSDKENQKDEGKSKQKDESSGSAPAPKIPPDIQLELGHVNPSVFRHHLFAPGSNTLTFICGPPMFIDSTNQFLLQLGFTDQQIVEF